MVTPGGASPAEPSTHALPSMGSVNDRKGKIMGPKAPALDRGLTVAERRSANFENRTLWFVMFVALIAATLSFSALQWVGSQFMDWRLAFGLPLAIDGFAIASSLGVVRSQASGEPVRQRVSEWLGVYLALGLSILGNVFHGLHTVSNAIPRELVVAFSTAIPIVVAYGIHIYGRAMSRGISAHVLAEDPDTIHMNLAHLGDELPVKAPAARQAPKRAALPQSPAPAPQQAPAPAPATQPAPVASPAVVDSDSTEALMARAQAVFDEMVRDDPFTRPSPSAIKERANIPRDRTVVSKWVKSMWEEYVENAPGSRGDELQDMLDAEREAAAARPLRVAGE